MRKLKLASGIWRYRIGSYYDDTNWTSGPTLEILTPAGRRVSVSREDVEAMATTPVGDWQKAITPGAIRRYIEERDL